MNNAQAAQDLGVSEATISRILSGQRTPSLHLMLAIRAKWRWSIERQADAVRCNHYPDSFRRKMEARRVRTRT